MIITIIGWYGTETIGDRAILAGIISFLYKSFGSFELYLGSLYPFFTERTLNEDYPFYRDVTDNKHISISIFNSKSPGELNSALKKSDLIIMGGGPLMDLEELYMIEYAFKKAKKLNKKTALLGCGIGPLYKKKYRKSVLNITLHSDLIILRDSISIDNLRSIYREFRKTPKEFFYSYDPSVESVLFFYKRNKVQSEAYIGINLRCFPKEYSINSDINIINRNIVDFMQYLSDHYSDYELRLIPMHYFHIGGDDRRFLNYISLTLGKKNIKVQNENLSLIETLQCFAAAKFNIGMRFHAVVFQTLVSGKNYILDYTEPLGGKIYGFIKDIDGFNFYKDKYVNLQKDSLKSLKILPIQNGFKPDIDLIEKKLELYPSLIRGMMS